MTKPTCGDCRYFVAHYIKLARRYRQVTCGHCLQAQNRHRQSTARACPRYQAIHQPIPAAHQ